MSTAAFLRMVKFSHTIFALPFAGIALVLALPGTRFMDFGAKDAYILIGQVLVCMVSLRTAAMGFNRLVDRAYDVRNPRTSMREIPAGVLSVGTVRTLVAVSAVVFVLAAFSINMLCGILSPLAILITFGYSYTKRFTMFSHFVLGLGIGLAPTGAWIAVRGELALVPVLWTLGMMLYIGGFDVLYSCQDAEFDRKEGLFSLPSRIGVPASLWIARTAHVGAAALFLTAGLLAGARIVFFGTIAVVSVLFLIEHVLVRPGKLDKIPVAFFNINAAVSSVLFVGILLDRVVPL
ncbi:MAG: UbiA family prenyltransferase [Spirochaetia bacterium]|nr:UbiA family prenyltransferase [Spirochaetia bacterium]